MSDSISLGNELRRKLVHLSSLVFPLLYFILSREQMLVLIGALVIMALTADIGPPLNKLVNRLFHNILRTHEYSGGRILLTGASWLLLSGFLCVALFPRHMVITALCVLAISDTIAALIGRRFGTHPLGHKTIEGTASFFISGILIVMMLAGIYGYSFSGYLIPGILGVCAGTYAELQAKRWHLDDNFIVPLTICSTMWLASLLFG